MSNLIQQSAICLAVLLCADAICRPEPPAASNIAIPALVQEAAPPVTVNDDAGLSHEAESVHLNTLPALDFPPMQAEPDAAIEPARGSVAVETYAAPSVVPVAKSESPAVNVAPYTCANGSCGVRYVPRQPVYQVRRRLFGGRFRR